MIRSAFDANVLASGFASSGGAPRDLLRAWLAGRFELIVSSHLLAEFLHTMTKPYFRERVSPETVSEFAALMARRATVVEITSEVHGIATHAEDDLVIATAVSAGADYLVTGDKELLAVGAHLGVTFVSPRAFLDLLDAGTA